VFVFVKNEVNVSATLRRPNIPLRNVFTPVINVSALDKVGIVTHACCTLHVPFGIRLMFMFVSHPVADIDGAERLAEFANVNSF
jgi:hypothetical protein